MNVVGVAGGIVLFQRQLQPQVGPIDLLKSTPELLLALEVLPFHASSMNCSAPIMQLYCVYCGTMQISQGEGGGQCPKPAGKVADALLRAVDALGIIHRSSFHPLSNLIYSLIYILRKFYNDLHVQSAHLDFYLCKPAFWNGEMTEPVTQLRVAGL